MQAILPVLLLWNRKERIMTNDYNTFKQSWFGRKT